MQSTIDNKSIGVYTEMSASKHGSHYQSISKYTYRLHFMSFFASIYLLVCIDYRL